MQSAVKEHQRLLAENNIGAEVCERDRVRVNARRVGLQAPLFADEAAQQFETREVEAEMRVVEKERHVRNALE